MLNIVNGPVYRYLPAVSAQGMGAGIGLSVICPSFIPRFGSGGLPSLQPACRSNGQSGLVPFLAVTSVIRL